MTFFKSLLFLPVSRFQKHPDAGEAVSIERVKLIWEECRIIKRIHSKKQANRMEGSIDDWEWMGPPAAANRMALQLTARHMSCKSSEPR